MTRSSPPGLKHPLYTVGKLGYYEMASLIFLSGAFWICSIPLVTVGACLLSLTDVLHAIYTGNSPASEAARLRAFVHGVRENFVRGLPLSFILLLVGGNTIGYFTIGFATETVDFILSGVIGIYLCVIVGIFASRLSGILVTEETDMTSAFKEAASSWIANPDIAILQVTIVTIALIVSLLIPVAVVLLLPAAAVLFEHTVREELTGHDPRIALRRYQMAA